MLHNNQVGFDAVLIYYFTGHDLPIHLLFSFIQPNSDM